MYRIYGQNHFTGIGERHGLHHLIPLSLNAQQRQHVYLLDVLRKEEASFARFVLQDMVRKWVYVLNVVLTILLYLSSLVS